MRRSVLVIGAALCLLMVSMHPALAQEVQRIAGGDGVELAVYEEGDPEGPPILFIHGFTGSHLVWGPQFSGPLAQEFRLVALDLRGHGASDKPLDPDSYTDPRVWAEDIAAVIREKGLDRPVLVGWSYAGYIFADYVRTFGTRDIGGLVFVGAATKAGSDEAFTFLTDEVLALFGDVLSDDVATSIQATRRFYPLLTAEPMDQETYETFLAGAMMVPPAVRQAMFGRELDNDDVLEALDVPTLVVHGGADGIVRLSSAEHIASRVAGAEVLVYDGVGHAPHLEDPERFAGDLAAFVRRAR